MRSFDYIVVGAGTAGCVLAARLSEDPAVSVLLLEAGSAFPPPLARDPLAWPALAGTEVDWRYTTVPQAGADRQELPYPQGKVLGGSGEINGLTHVRGDPASYDAWDEAGAIGWTYASMLPFFMRSETTLGGDPAYRGQDGPVPVDPPATTDPLWEAFFTAAVEAGHHPNPDSNGPNAEGTSWNEVTVRDGARRGAAEAYLAPAAERSNLSVLADAGAVRLVVEHGVCRGVAYRVDGHTGVTYADREVLLAAGTIGSPRLLMLSGIGPGDHLRQVGLPVVADLPGVGGNLQDHPRSQVAYAANRPVGDGTLARRPHVLARSGDGPPDLQLSFLAEPIHPRWMPGDEPGFSVVFALMSPDSRGTVRLSDPDPFAPPLIDPAFLTDDGDVERMVAGLRAAREVGNAPALAHLRSGEEYPGAAVTSTAVLAQYVRDTATSSFDPVGTCRMGIDGAAVVDPSLRVHGIAGLRVADASVMPSIVSGNANAPTLAIAERAAGLVREEPTAA